MPSHPLDNPVWAALSSQHAALAVRSGRFLRYRGDVGRFAAVELPATGFDGLAGTIPAGEIVAVVTTDRITPPADLEMVEAMRVPQMVVARPLPERDLGIRRLGDDDVPAMLELTALTRPGPFLPRTIEMGSYFGILAGTRLVAMAGERMQLPGFTEISAVCTHPEFQGRGYARALMARVAGGITARGETPFLHVRADNTGAIAVYRALGLAVRHEMTITVLRKPAASA